MDDRGRPPGTYREDPDSGAHINTVEGDWAHRKRDMPPGSWKKSGFRGHLEVAMLRTKLKFSANAGGREIVSGFFQMANDFLEKPDEKENFQEFEHLNSDSELDSDVDSEVDLMALPPATEPIPPTPEPMPTAPEQTPPTPEQPGLSGYRSCKEKGSRLFTAKNRRTLLSWRRIIPRKDLTRQLSHNVCHIHFIEEDIILKNGGANMAQ